MITRIRCPVPHQKTLSPALCYTAQSFYRRPYGMIDDRNISHIADGVIWVW